MGILQKITERTEIVQHKSAARGEEKPSAPCPADHPLPYGLHHWLDAFGHWRCTQCEPPAAISMVRDQCLVDPAPPYTPADVGLQIGLSELLPAGFRIVAVVPPGVRIDTPGPIIGAVDVSQVVFSDEATRAERTDVIAAMAWFERNDKRKNKRQGEQDHAQ